MELQVHVEEMLKRFSCYATYRALADIGKNSVQKLAEEGSTYASRTVYREVNVVDRAREDEERTDIRVSGSPRAPTRLNGPSYQRLKNPPRL